MFHDIIKEKLLNSISRTVSNLEQFVRHPGRDFTRNLAGMILTGLPQAMCWQAVPFIGRSGKILSYR